MRHAQHFFASGRRANRVNRSRDPAVLLGLVTTMAIAEPLMTLPQVYEVWVRHRTVGVSLATWSFFTLGAAVWLAYGLAIHSRPLIISNVLWVALEGAVALGLLAR